MGVRVHPCGSATDGRQDGLPMARGVSAHSKKPKDLRYNRVHDRSGAKLATSPSNYNRFLRSSFVQFGFD
ncbi:hypothetical protein NPIL_314571 [Nephila pilipes]|uniref:Uncharacterized protein n=1 Tax=Nephila pilipes TaxID=299642 RepID=A0A8X6TXS0_NEPPI|nr:hypothetical protein NPIL_314571 [Nephila pilipes]